MAKKTIRKKAKAKASNLKELFEGKQEAMLKELAALRRGIIHMPTMGEAGENKWRQLFRDYLPSRYAIEKAHVVDSSGKISEQIDLVIFDRQYANLAFNQDGIIYVPAEAVYAVCELKQNINKAQLKYAAEKIASVRKLKRTSAAVPQISGKAKRKQLKKVIGALIAIESDYSPAYGATFKKHKKALTGNKSLDFVFTLSNGLPDARTKTGSGLVLFIFKLLDALQKMGNAPAIDFGMYIDSI